MDWVFLGLSLALFGLALGLAAVSHKLEGGKQWARSSTSSAASSPRACSSIWCTRWSAPRSS